MTFASLEEAWGVPAFAAAAEHESRPPQQQRREFPKAYGGGGEEPVSVAPAKPFDAGDEEQAVRGALERAYRARGTLGVLELLPPECHRQVAASVAASRPRRGPQRPRRRRHRRRSWVRRLTDALSDPNNVLLLLLLAAFVVVLTWEGSRAQELPNIASLHMSPFPLGSGSAGI